jgi:hypothetical protein
MANQEGVDIIIKATDQYTTTINKIAASNKLFGQSVENTQKQISALEKYMVTLVANGLDPADKKIVQLKNDYDKLNQTMNNGQTPLKQSNKQWTSLALVVQDLPYGFRGIQNNLPALFGSLASGAGAAYFAFSAVVAVITAMDMGLFKTTKATDALTEANKEYAESIKSAIGSAGEEITKIQTLTRIASDNSVAMEKRLQAVKSLQEEYPAYFGNLSQEAILNGDIKTAVNDVKIAIIERAKATAVAGKINKLSAEKFAKEEELYQLALIKTAKIKRALAAAAATEVPEERIPALLQLVVKDVREQENVIQSSVNKIDSELKRLGVVYENSTKNSMGLDIEAPEGKTAPKPTVSKVYENLAQEEFNYYKDSIFRAEEYYAKLNNIQKINALMEATIRGASAEELFAIQQTYEQKELNFRKSIEDKKFAIRQQSEERQKQLTDSANKEKLDSQVTYTDNYIKSLDAQLKAELRLHKGNVILQQQDIQNKINLLKKAQVFAAGNVKATEDINAALLKLNGTLTGVGTNWTNTANKILSITNDFLINSFTSLGESIGQALAGEKVQPFVALGELLASSLIDLGKALISFAVLEGLALTALKDPTKWPLALAAGTAAVVAGSYLKSKLNKDKTQKFANGGIISGPTYGLMGEYPGAASNPEVVAPLDKLKSMIGGGGGTLETRISGNDLLILLNKAERNNQSTF